MLNLFRIEHSQPCAGISILVAVTVDFHDVYGLSLNVKDIDPTYTLGELAKGDKLSSIS